MLAITRQHWYNTERRKLMDDKKIQWHPPYVAAMNLEMRHDIDRFIFVPEYILNTGTLKIDLFIEDTGNIAPANEIGKIFRKYNVLEYKNPKDKLGIDVFVKVQSYADLFKASGEKPDSRNMKSITVSYVRESKPEKLFKYLKKCGVSIEIPYKGIYYLYGSSIPFTTQIIVTKELDHEKHKWLCALSGRLEEQDLKNLLAGISSLDGKMEKEYADSVLEAALKANKRLAEKLRSDENMSKTLLEIMEPVLKEREEKIREQVRRESRQEGILEGRREGRREGRQEGMVYAYYEMNMKTMEIAKKLQLTEEEVLEIIKRKNE